MKSILFDTIVKTKISRLQGSGIGKWEKLIMETVGVNTISL
ncbi:MAG: hypothetical protein U9N37_02750 [Thermodesulfobacteriota bacterium]|nr:hypothetical protein [Thermodesulfobacteriota bacterium]